MSTLPRSGRLPTGMSFLAKIIHQNSTRAQRQFVGIHCGAIPDALLESELFGHERGAFTGADRRRLGKFEIATGGTLFLERLRPFHHKEIDGVQQEVLEALLRYDWPGNIRELENLLERDFILESSGTLTPSSFPEELFAPGQANAQITVDTAESLADARSRAASIAEREYLKRQLEDHRGRIAFAAEAAGITPRQLNTLMTKHGLRKEDFRRAE